MLLVAMQTVKLEGCACMCFSSDTYIGYSDVSGIQFKID
jgi:hypothetical protein